MNLSKRRTPKCVVKTLNFKSSQTSRIKSTKDPRTESCKQNNYKVEKLNTSFYLLILFIKGVQQLISQQVEFSVSKILGVNDTSYFVSRNYRIRESLQNSKKKTFRNEQTELKKEENNQYK